MTTTRYWLDQNGDLWTSEDDGATWTWGDVENTAADMPDLGGIELTPVPAVTVDWVNDENVTITANGQQITALNHGEHGWDGMTAGIQVATKLAAIVGATVTTTGTPNL